MLSIRGWRRYSGPTPRECHEMSCFVMRRPCGGLSSIAFRSLRAPAGRAGRADPVSRVSRARLRARPGGRFAPARLARLIARASRMQDTLLPSVSSGFFRAGAKAGNRPRGRRFLCPYCRIFSQKSSLNPDLFLDSRTNHVFQAEDRTPPYRIHTLPASASHRVASTLAPAPNCRPGPPFVTPDLIRGPAAAFPTAAAVGERARPSGPPQRPHWTPARGPG